jgi:hypothetical protein
MIELTQRTVATMAIAGLWFIGMPRAAASSPTSAPATASSTQPSEKPLAVTPISLKMESTPANIVIEALGELAGVRILALQPGGPVTMKRMSIQADRSPFLEVLLKICDENQLDITQEGGIHSIFLRALKEDAPTDACFQWKSLKGGAFLCAVENISMRNQLELGLPDASPQGSLDITVAVAADPRLQLNGAVYAIKNIKAIDDTGALLTPRGASKEDRDDFYPVGDVPVWQCGASFEYPSSGARVIKRLTGTIRVLAPTRFETITIPEVSSAAGVEAKAAGLRMRIDSLETTDEAYNVVATLFHDGKKGREWERVKRLTFSAGPALSNDQGDRLVARPAKNRGDDDIEWHVTFPFPREGVTLDGPLTFTWDIPTDEAKIDVPIEFTDIPLP